MSGGVLLTEAAAARMAAATRWVEAHGGAVVSDGGWYPYRPDESATGSIAVSKTTAKWVLGQSQELTVYEGDPPGEAAPAALRGSPRKVTAWNRLADIPSGAWVVIGQAHTASNGAEVWYLLSTQLSKTDVVTKVECVSGKIVITTDSVWAIPKDSQP